MREIKFRGLDITGGTWHYGFLTIPEVGKYKGRSFISNKAGMPLAFEVRPETVGQYIGLKDKNGVEDYHKNILRNALTKLVVTTEYGEYQCKNGTGYGWYLAFTNVPGVPYIPYPNSLEDWEIIGNIYETPELCQD